MNALRRLLTWNMSTDTFDAQFGMYASFFAALAVLALGFHKLTTLSLTETEAFLGILLILAVALQAVCLGLLVSRPRGASSSNA